MRPKCAAITVKAALRYLTASSGFWNCARRSGQGGQAGGGAQQGGQERVFHARDSFERVTR
jgi:hypothetical protein